MRLKRQALYGICWFFISLLVSVINDSFVKYLGNSIPPFEIAFFRFFFATISFAPLFLIYGFKPFKTQRIKVHLFRGVVLCAAMFLWCLGMSNVKIMSATVTSFTIPIFVLIMAPFAIKEKVSLKLWIATLFCFGGIVILLDSSSQLSFTFTAIMLCSAFLFAILDIINKNFIGSEPMVVMLFYSNLFTTLISAFSFFMHDWVLPSIEQIFLLVMLGLGANAILYCILKAFTYVNASSLSPYRYLELVISFTLGYFIFEELPDIRLLISAVIIVPSTLYICITQLRSTKVTSEG